MSAASPLGLCRRDECPHGTPCGTEVVESVLAIAPVPVVAACVADDTIVWCNDEARALGLAEGSPLTPLVRGPVSGERPQAAHDGSAHSVAAERAPQSQPAIAGTRREVRVARLDANEGRQVVAFVTVRRGTDERLAALERAARNIARELAWIGVDAADREPAPGWLPGANDLNDREREVFSLTARGQAVGAIAQRLSLSPSTVRNHLSSIYQKLGVRNRSELLQLVLTRRSTVLDPAARSQHIAEERATGEPRADEGCSNPPPPAS
jgi:DNA-binding CsgD family transcriptional regulator